MSTTHRLDQHSDLSVLVRDSDTPLARAHREGLVNASDVQLSRLVQVTHADSDPLVALTLGLAFAAARLGSTCLDLAAAPRELADAALQDSDLTAEEFQVAREGLLARVQLPALDDWLEALAGSALVGDAGSAPNAHPARLVDGLVYLERYWGFEELVAQVLAERQAEAPPTVEPGVLASGLVTHRGKNIEDADQSRAITRAVSSWTTVLAGGPGTGKTSTVARMVAGIADQFDRSIRVALAAPSGKAASRLAQAVHEHPLNTTHPINWTPGLTLHRLLGTKGLTGEFRHGPGNQLPHDVVVVDEVSMVGLAMFATLLSAVRHDCHLVLVGDPHQLQAVSAGTVLADVVESGLTVGGGSVESAVTTLTTVHRHEGAIEQLAAAIRAIDTDAALDLLRDRGHDSGSRAQLLDVELTRDVDWSNLDPELETLVRNQWRDLVVAAEAGDASSALAALDRHRTLCGHRRGLFGVSNWTQHTLAMIRAEQPRFGRGVEYHPGRPVMIRSNDDVLNISNGDTGVVISDGDKVHVSIGDAANHRQFSPGMLRDVEDLYAMTVHKSQGSQFEHVTLVLPPLGSPLLTRDLLYTAITRATTSVRVLGTVEQVRTAMATETRRVSGLASRWRRHDR